jgi:hypothetical protein
MRTLEEDLLNRVAVAFEIANQIGRSDVAIDLDRALARLTEELTVTEISETVH